MSTAPPSPPTKRPHRRRFAVPHSHRPAAGHLCADGRVLPGHRESCAPCLAAETIALAARLKSLLLHPAVDPLTVSAAARDLRPALNLAASAIQA